MSVSLSPVSSILFSPPVVSFFALISFHCTLSSTALLSFLRMLSSFSNLNLLSEEIEDCPHSYPFLPASLAPHILAHHSHPSL